MMLDGFFSIRAKIEFFTYICSMEKIKSLRVVYQSFSEDKMTAKTTDLRTVFFHCTKEQGDSMKGLHGMLLPGYVFNLLNAELDRSEGKVTAEFIIFEPDYLLDISSLAECFKPYGRHPLLIMLSRFQQREMTPPLLLGSAANLFIDELVYETPDRPVDFMETLKKLFRVSPFEYTACENLKDPRTESDFFLSCRRHFEHIRRMVHSSFPKNGIDREKIILEPSFISNALGLQGRLDILLHDYSKLVELKSGRAVEDLRTGGKFAEAGENHYTQTILYMAMLEFNLDLSPDKIDAYLLYSKYPILSREKASRTHLAAALVLRNLIVAVECHLQKLNSTQVTIDWMNDINSRYLNVKRISGKLFTSYFAPTIDRVHNAFARLNDRDKQYFLRTYNFIIKEQWLSKCGEREYEGIKRAAALWNAPLEDKLAAGELLYNLRITDNRAAEEDHSITLSIPEYEDLYLPNFRPGDMVVLYERNAETDTVNNRQVFKGSIEQLEDKVLKIRLRYRQKNPHVWRDQSSYAIEHDYLDASYTSLFRGVTTFLYANQNRRDLLLSSSTNDEIALIVGPPGTGKTSIALKQRVETEWKNGNNNILLLSYTNRAVDEICKALSDIEAQPPFIRIGNELNCAPEFRSHLLGKQLEPCTKRTEVAEIIRRNRIFVGTVASVSNRTELFQLKHFDLAIVDEATQLLEPFLLNIFCAKDSSGGNAVDRFVLIGDHKQLPAVVLQTKGESRVDEPELNAIGLTNMSDSLFERLYRKYKNEDAPPERLTILSKQGRMHPAIAAFPSEYFYDGLLESAGLPHQSEQWRRQKRLNFYHVRPSRKEHSNKINRKEAEKVVDICRTLYKQCRKNKEPFLPESIGIITPFRNQIALIRQLLQQTGINEFSDIVVDTVERFQGSQQDVIIYSFCIQTESQLQTLPSWLKEDGKYIDRKLNVVLTRAREQLHIIGNEDLLSKNPLYWRLIRHIKTAR
jgi:hypothetical protein